MLSVWTLWTYPVRRAASAIPPGRWTWLKVFQRTPPPAKVESLVVTWQEAGKENQRKPLVLASQFYGTTKSENVSDLN